MTNSNVLIPVALVSLSAGFFEAATLIFIMEGEQILGKGNSNIAHPGL